MLILSCNKDDTVLSSSTSTNQNPVTFIDPELKPFVESFYIEMEERGLNYRNKPLSAIFVNELSAPNSSQFCAYGYPNLNGVATVEVIKNIGCWLSKNRVEHENLIYHELGHALMSKSHTYSLFPNGSPTSIMCSSEVTDNYRVYNKYQTDQKIFYLDQLVSGTAMEPDWASEKFYSYTLETDTFDNSLDGWEHDTEYGTNNSYTFFVDESHAISLPYALGISSSGNNNPEAVGYWYKYYDISNFNNCSNLVVSADIIADNLTEGYVGIVIDFIEYPSPGIPLRFGRYYNLTTENSANLVLYEDFKATGICLTEEVQAVKIHFYLKSTAQTSVFIDNLKIDLYE